MSIIAYEDDKRDIKKYELKFTHKDMQGIDALM